MGWKVFWSGNSSIDALSIQVTSVSPFEQTYECYISAYDVSIVFCLNSSFMHCIYEANVKNAFWTNTWYFYYGSVLHILLLLTVLK